MNKLNSLAEKGFKGFEEYYKKIWEDYSEYGEVVLSKKLDQDEEKVKEIIVKSKNYNDLYNNLEEFWENNCMIVINSCADIKKAFNETPYGERFYIRGFYAANRHPRFIISEEFYKKLRKLYKYGSHKDISYIKYGDDIYVIKFEKIGTYAANIQIAYKIPHTEILED